MYYTNVDSQVPHMSFIGCFCPLHSGHTWIIEKKLKEEDKPVSYLCKGYRV